MLQFCSQTLDAPQLASESFQYWCERAITTKIYADLVIADLTEHNPNVMFELGVRIAQEKPAVLMKAQGTGPLFDIDNMLRVFEYSPNLWATTIEKDMPNLREFIKGVGQS